MQHWDIVWEWNKQGVHYPFSMEMYINQCIDDKKITKKDLIIKLFEILEYHDILTLSDIKGMYGIDFDRMFNCKRIEGE